MNNKKLLDFLQDNLGQYKEYSKQEYYFKCPFPDCSGSHKKKLAIKLDENDAAHYLQWHCWVCNASGMTLYSMFKKLNIDYSKIKQLQTILGDTASVKDVNKIKDSFTKNDKKADTVSLPEEFKSFKEFSKNPEYRNALHYIKERNITIGDIVKYRMGYCDSGDYKGYVVIPSYDKNLNLNYFVTRDYYGRDFRYKNPLASKNIIFNEVHINWKMPVVLVEGVFDAIAVKRNAIPLLGKAINDSLRMKLIEEKVTDIYLCLDKDAILNSIKYVEEFLRNEINVYLVNLTGKDPSDMGFKLTNQLIKDAKKMDFSDLIKLKMKF